jgi:hypothetical protein
MNYRAFYQSQVNKEYNHVDFDIHHINGNRKDNRITNLVALPKKLHHQYHYYKGMKSDYDKCQSEIVGTNELPYIAFYIEKFIHNNQKFLDVIKETAKWVDERDMLLLKNME